MCSVSAPSGPDTRSAGAVGLLLPAALAEAVGGQRLLVLPQRPVSGADTGAHPEADAAGSITVAVALDRLREQQPGVYSRICDETGAVRRYVNLYLDGEDIRDLAGQSTVLASGAQLLVLQSIAGG
nr:MoaD/ThiS family protein [Arthrobacter sp. zg-Y750]